MQTQSLSDGFESYLEPSLASQGPENPVFAQNPGVLPCGWGACGRCSADGCHVLAGFVTAAAGAGAGGPSDQDLTSMTAPTQSVALHSVESTGAFETRADLPPPPPSIPRPTSDLSFNTAGHRDSSLFLTGPEPTPGM